MKKLSLIVLLCVAAAGAPLGAHAENNCASNVVIFSRMATPAGQQQTPNNNALWCAADPNPDPDTRLINPGADTVAIRFIQDLGAATPKVTVILDGLGFQSKAFEMKRVASTLGTFLYDSAPIPLPSGAASSGCITATVYDLVSDPEMLEALDANTFHTVDAQTTAC